METTLETVALAAFAKNSYGLTATGLAHTAGLALVDSKRVIKSLLAKGEIVTYKVARNAAMYSLPYTCAWSTRAAEEALARGETIRSRGTK